MPDFHRFYRTAFPKVQGDNADSTLHLGTAYTAGSLDTAYTVSNVTPETSFDPICTPSLFQVCVFPIKHLWRLILSRRQGFQ